jgi:uncharacterized protein (DUF1778 family)
MPRELIANITILVTPDEKELIQKAAEHRGESVSGWIRSVMVERARKELER